MPRQPCDTSRRGRFRTQPKKTSRRRHLANKYYNYTVRRKIKSRDTRKKGGSSGENYWDTYYEQHGNPLLFLGIDVEKYKKEQRVEKKIKMIRRAFKKTALKYHPDKCKTPQKKKKMVELMIVATSAEATLINDLEKNIGDGTKPPTNFGAGSWKADAAGAAAGILLGFAVYKSTKNFILKPFLNNFFKNRRIVMSNKKQPMLSVSKIKNIGNYLMVLEEHKDDRYTSVENTPYAALLKLEKKNDNKYIFKVQNRFKLIRPNIKHLEATVNVDRNTIVFDNIRDKVEGVGYKSLTERTRKRSASSRRRLSSSK